ncbi:MAG: hypothetical protein QNJ09_12155 [Paracoccaceae bacterium]|nr:hypothetical protein [Paracoccaceae bacterium]
MTLSIPATDEATSPSTPPATGSPDETADLNEADQSDAEGIDEMNTPTQPGTEEKKEAKPTLEDAEAKQYKAKRDGELAQAELDRDSALADIAEQRIAAIREIKARKQAAEDEKTAADDRIDALCEAAGNLASAKTAYEAKIGAAKTATKKLEDAQKELDAANEALAAAEEALETAKAANEEAKQILPTIDPEEEKERSEAKRVREVEMVETQNDLNEAGFDAAEADAWQAYFERAKEIGEEYPPKTTS